MTKSRGAHARARERKEVSRFSSKSSKTHALTLDRSELKPGTKGISLKPDQFAALLAFGESIQAASASAKK